VIRAVSRPAHPLLSPPLGLIESSRATQGGFYNCEASKTHDSGAGFDAGLTASERDQNRAVQAGARDVECPTSDYRKEGPLIGSRRGQARKRESTFSRGSSHGVRRGETPGSISLEGEFDVAARIKSSISGGRLERRWCYSVTCESHPDFFRRKGRVISLPARIERGFNARRARRDGASARLSRRPRRVPALLAHCKKVFWWERRDDALFADTSSSSCALPSLREGFGHAARARVLRAIETTAVVERSRRIGEVAFRVGAASAYRPPFHDDRQCRREPIERYGLSVAYEMR